MTRVSEVQIVPIKAQNGLIAFASIVINDSFYFGSIGVHSRIDGSGYRLTYPTKPVGGRDLNIYHPTNKEASEAIERAIFAKVKEVIERCNDRYNSTKTELQRI